MKKITIIARDEFNTLVNLLKCIKINGNCGHSFTIEVEPEHSKNTKTFFWDGDGSDMIKDIVEEDLK